MTTFNRMELFLVAGLAILVAMQVGQKSGIMGMAGLIAPAEARVGRPLTPVSVAGVARRTVRRCAVGVYNC